MDERLFTLVRQIKERISLLAPVAEVRVFGSRARGDQSPDSDLDLYIVMESLTPERKDDIRHICWELGLHHRQFISPLIVSRHEVEQTPLRSAPIIANIRSEGIAV